MKTYVVYGENAPVFCIDVPDNFFLTHNRFNGWISCFDSEREALTFLAMHARIEDELAEAFWPDGRDGIVNKTKQRGVFSGISQCELFA